jgi:lipoprotein-releasing system ATP-binding protein
MPLLAVSNLHKTYTLGRFHVPVLRGVHLTLSEGEFVAILGSSGSGKSTLLHLIGGLDRADRARPRAHGRCPACKHELASDAPDRCPQCGQRTAQIPASSVVFDSREVTTFSASQLDEYRSRDVGFVFQFYHLLPELTVIQNVLIAAMVKKGAAYAAASPALTREATELLARVDLSHRLYHRPAELSGGERQRVAIARALINRPRMLLADEPTGNLDRATGGKVLEMLLAIRAERAQSMLVVTHDPATAERADRIVKLADGMIERANL